MNTQNIFFHMDSENLLIARDVPSQRTLEIVVQAPAARQQVARAHLNLALVLDRSGSMHNEKLEYAKQAVLHVLDLLQEQDRVALITYDDQIDVVSGSIAVTDANRQELKRKIMEIHPGGSTNLSGGWLAGCQEVAKIADAVKENPASAWVHRVLLLTDGLANVGITDLEELSVHARELAARGISTSTFGIGTDFNEHLLEAMANQGQGNFFYIDSPMRIADIFVREFHELAAVTARDVELSIQLPEKVDAQVLGGWRTDCTPRQIHLYLGNLAAGRRQEIYLIVLLPPMSLNDMAPSGSLVFQGSLRALDDQGHIQESTAEIIFPYADAQQMREASTDRALLQRSAQVRISEAANEALKYERSGDGEKAGHLLTRALEANRDILSSTEIEYYENLVRRMKQGMGLQERKAAHYTQYASRRRREE